MQRGGVANFYLRKVISTPLFSHFEALSLLLLNGCTCSPVRGWMTRRLPAAFFPPQKATIPIDELPLFRTQAFGSSK